MPTAAERALDEAISVPGGRQFIAEHTRRRWLVGALGEVSYFPGYAPAGDGDSTVVRAAVAGTGRVGTSSESNAVRLYASLVRELAGLACVEHAVTAPIGSGAGNLSIDQVARALVVGCGEGLAGLPPEDRRLRRVSVVEMNRLRAEKLHAALTEAARIEAARAEAVHGQERVQVLPEMTTAPGGEVGPDAVVLHLARSLLTRLTRHHGDEATERLLGDVRTDLPEEIRDQMAAKEELAAEPAKLVDVRLRATGDGDPVLDDPLADGSVPTRITALQPRDAGGVSWSAVTARATVPEREVRLDRNLLAELIRRRDAGLVIGDPGGGTLSLSGAREEAVAVATVLKRHGIRVEAYIGSAGSAPTQDARPATRLDVLAKVLTGRYDLIHYAGHGAFDPESPEMSGWLFADGLLTARELTQMSRAPWLVMANACWSVALPDTGGADGGSSAPSTSRTPPTCAPPRPGSAWSWRTSSCRASPCASASGR
ncbi:CHAT domain-containing protein [Geodermatophilus sp. URMC 62]|uniref:CHAT domain-containing protein n=1 Tax=Geodermatophilus sp. URMC 62 TaxID=3423414 RepID=UPI00406CFE99